MKQLRSTTEKEERLTMSEVLTRSKERISKLGEVFTPTELVDEMLDELPSEMWEDGKTFLDPTCGNGQFLVRILERKIALNHKETLSTIYGADIMQDNVDECKGRLLALAGDTKANRKILETNIVCEDGLTYDYSFGTGLFEW